MLTTDDNAMEGGSEVVVVANNAGKRKTVLVDANGKETVSGQQKKAKKDDTLNNKMRALIHHLHEVSAISFKFEEVDYLSLEKTMQLTSNIWTAYVVLKQQSSGSGRVAEKIKDNQTFKAGDKEVGKDAYIADVKKLFGLYDVKFVNTEEDLQKRGCFQSNLSLLYTFKMRMQEGVYMNTKFTISETKDAKKEVEVSQYGVQPRHYNLLSGSNFTPMCQSALMQSLGPATLLINLARCTDTKFQPKWKEAAKACMSGVAGINGIVELIAGTGAAHSSLISNVLDICNFGIAKINNKAMIPWCLLRTLNIEHPPYKLWAMRLLRIPVQGHEHPLFTMPTIPTDFSEDILNIDFSGKGYWNFHKKVADKEIKMKMLDESHANIMGQYLTLSMTGLYDSDTAVFKFMFGEDLKPRKDYGSCLASRKSKGKDYSVKILKPVHVSKFATATQGKYGLNQQLDMVPSQRMSGMTSYTMIDNDAYTQSLKSKGTNLFISSINPSELEGVLWKQKEFIESKIGSSRKVELGTTSWFKVDATSSRTNYGSTVQDVVVKTGKTFFSQN
nr:MAG: nucleoprotein [Byreska virus]